MSDRIMTISANILLLLLISSMFDGIRISFNLFCCLREYTPNNTIRQIYSSTLAANTIARSSLLMANSCE